MAKILIVDDETDMVAIIKRYAERDGYETKVAYNGLQAVEICHKEDFDLIIMDIMMPEMDGFKAYKNISSQKDIPVLFLSAKSEEYDKLFGFEVGADDYVTKPFSAKELMARANAIIKRYGKKSDKDNKIVIETLEVDTLGRMVYIDGKETELTAKEYELLVYLMRNRGIALSREQILNSVWGYEYFGDDRTVDWMIKMLRGKIGKYRDKILTVRGVGYKFEK